MLTYLSRGYELNYWNAVESSESFGAEALTTQTLSMQEELCSCARAATADQFNTKSFNLETQQWLWSDEPVASWQPWLLLGFMSAGGCEPRKSPANETVLALPPYSWSQMTLHCISFPGTYSSPGDHLWADTKSHPTKFSHQFGY